MIRNLAWAAILAGIVHVPHATAAQARVEFGGIYETETPAGEHLTLTLLEDARGAVTGTLAGPNGTFQVEGQIEADRLNGAIAIERDDVFFEAAIDGGELWVYLSGGGGAFDYLRSREIVFRIRGTSARGFGAAPRVPGADPLRGGNPLGLGNPLAPDYPDGSGNLAGTFTDGFVTIEISGGADRYTGRISVGGRQYPFEANLVDMELRGRFGNGIQDFAFTAVRDGPFLMLESDGQTYYLRFGGDRFVDGSGGRPDAFDPPPGYGRGRIGRGQQLSDGVRESLEWVDYLANRRLTTLRRTGGRASSELTIELCDSGVFLDLRLGRREVIAGEWRIVSPNDRFTYLELRYDIGQFQQHELTMDQDGVLLDRSQASVSRSFECR